jgi:uncharacterized protein YcfL
MKRQTNLILAVLLVVPFISNAQILNVDRNQILTDTAKFVTGSIAFKFHLDNKNATPEQKNSYIALENKNDLVFVGLKKQLYDLEPDQVFQFLRRHVYQHRIRTYPS